MFCLYYIVLDLDTMYISDCEYPCHAKSMNIRLTIGLSIALISAVEILKIAVSGHEPFHYHEVHDIIDLNCNMSQLMSQRNFSRYVTWNTNENGTLEILIGDCRLDLIDQAIARRIMRQAAPHGLAFIGDSLSRYQYLNLVYFLEHGKWQVESDHPNEEERAYESWFEFYRITNSRLGGHELCDCHRDNVRETLENRYYEDNTVKVSYLQLFGHNTPILLHDPELLRGSTCSETDCVQPLCQPGLCDTSITPIMNLGFILDNGAIHNLMARCQNYSHVLVNTGLWWIKDGVNEFSTSHSLLLLNEMTQFHTEFPTVQVHWKTTTASKLQNPTDPNPDLEFAQALTQSSGFKSYYDAWTLTAILVQQRPEMLWDHVHFFSPVYKGLNLVLLAYIISLEPLKPSVP